MQLLQLPSIYLPYYRMSDRFLFLRVMNNKLFFIISVVMMALSMCGLAVGTSKIVLFVAIALVGYGNSNIFSMVFARALQSVPDKQNEVSGLMIMGLFGGTIFSTLDGFCQRWIRSGGCCCRNGSGCTLPLFLHSKNE